jgi:hypothetical protein
VKHNPTLNNFWIPVFLFLSLKAAGNSILVRTFGEAQLSRGSLVCEVFHDFGGFFSVALCKLSSMHSERIPQLEAVGRMSI